MKLFHKFVVAGLAAAGLLAIAPAALAQKVFKIGAVVSMTGPASGFAKDWGDGFEAYVKNWNARGGYQGRQVVLEKLDDESNPTSAVNAFRKLASDPEVTAVWLAQASQTAMGIKTLSDEFKVPVISGGGLELLGKPAGPYFFKLAATAPDFANAIVEHAGRKGYKRIALLNSSEANGQAEAAGLKESIAKGGMQLVAAETYNPTDTNFTAQLTKIRAARPDFFYNGATGNPATLVFKQAKQLNVDMPMGMSVAGVTGAFFTGIGGTSSAEGLVSALPVGAVSSAATKEGAAELSQLQAALGKQPIPFHTFGWETGLITEWGLKHSDGTRKGLRDALDKAQNVPSINGPISFTSDNHIGQDIRGVVVVRMGGGTWTKAD